MLCGSWASATDSICVPPSNLPNSVSTPSSPARRTASAKPTPSPWPNKACPSSSSPAPKLNSKPWPRKSTAKKYAGVDKTKYIVCDYSNFDEKTRARVARELEGLDVGLLINNVGQSYRYPQFFHELTDDEVGAVLEMNINSTVWMTRMVLDGMAKRRRGSIVNLSSGSAEHTMPLLAEYGAAKMFVARFSESLDAEYRGRGVRVQCQIPFYVATKLAKLRKSLTVPTAEAYVAMSMRWLGYGGVVQPFWLHGIQGWVMKILPSALVDMGVMSMHAGIRKRGLKKDAKIAAEGKQE